MNHEDPVWQQAFAACRQTAIALALGEQEPDTAAAAFRGIFDTAQRTDQAGSVAPAFNPWPFERLGLELALATELDGRHSPYCACPAVVLAMAAGWQQTRGSVRTSACFTALVEAASQAVADGSLPEAWIPATAGHALWADPEAASDLLRLAGQEPERRADLLPVIAAHPLKQCLPVLASWLAGKTPGPKQHIRLLHATLALEDERHYRSIDLVQLAQDCAGLLAQPAGLAQVAQLAEKACNARRDELAAVLLDAIETAFPQGFADHAGRWPGDQFFLSGIAWALGRREQAQVLARHEGQGQAEPDAAQLVLALAGDEQALAQLREPLLDTQLHSPMLSFWTARLRARQFARLKQRKAMQACIAQALLHYQSFAPSTGADGPLFGAGVLDGRLRPPLEDMVQLARQHGLDFNLARPWIRIRTLLLAARGALEHQPVQIGVSFICEALRITAARPGPANAAAWNADLDLLADARLRGFDLLLQLAARASENLVLTANGPQLVEALARLQEDARC